MDAGLFFPSDGDVGNKISIHYIQMNPIGSGLFDGLHRFSQFAEVGGKN